MQAVKWDEAENSALLAAVENMGNLWKPIAEHLGGSDGRPTRSANAYKKQWQALQKKDEPDEGDGSEPEPSPRRPKRKRPSRQAAKPVAPPRVKREHTVVRYSGEGSRRRDCHSAAPPSPFSRRFNSDDEGVPAK